MSYIRNSDVYMYHDVAGFIWCCGCKLKAPEEHGPKFSSRKAALLHLKQHKEKGHDVSGIQRLQQELREKGDSVEVYCCSECNQDIGLAVPHLETCKEGQERKRLLQRLFQKRSE